MCLVLSPSPRAPWYMFPIRRNMPRAIRPTSASSLPARGCHKSFGVSLVVASIGKTLIGISQACRQVLKTKPIKAKRGQRPSELDQTELLLLLPLPFLAFDFAARADAASSNSNTSSHSHRWACRILCSAVQLPLKAVAQVVSVVQLTP